MIKAAVKAALKDYFGDTGGDNSLTLEIKEKKEKLEQTQKQLTDTRIELEEVKAQKAREEEEIAHKVKILKEKSDVELAKEKQKIIAEYQEKELELMKDHQQKINDLMEGNLKDMKEMYNSISDTLGNAVNVDIKKRQG